MEQIKAMYFGSGQGANPRDTGVVLRGVFNAAIAERAKLDDAEIHWGDETAVVNTDVRGRGYGPKAQMPVAYAVGGTRHKLSTDSASF